MVTTAMGDGSGAGAEPDVPAEPAGLGDPGSPGETGAWVNAVSLQRLQDKGPLSVKVGGRQIAIFLHQGQPLACNNRCPHEGYPLSEGHLQVDAGETDGPCVLTCQWHNWKFDLRSGANLYGGDALRTYPARLQDGQVWIDVTEEAATVRVERVLAQLDAAVAEHDLARIARELARLEQAGGRVETAVARSIERGHAHLRYGMSHAHAAAEAWLRLRDELVDPAQRLACVTEALGYLGDEVLREAHYPYTDAVEPWDAKAFLAAIEAQDEAAALACLHGALQTEPAVPTTSAQQPSMPPPSARLAALLPTLLTAALAHYNDFGHSVIYLGHVVKLVDRLGQAALRPLLRAWLRSVIYATREDLLPDFKAYAPALAQWPSKGAAEAIGGAGHPSAAVPVDLSLRHAAAVDSAAFEGLSVRQTLAAALAHAEQPNAALLAALLQAGAHHLLRFDETVATRSDGAVADNIGWLDFSHALTFAQALRELLPCAPMLWPQGLLQLALFVGRNSSYLRADLDSATATAAWCVEDEPAFDQRCRDQMLDHGQDADIFTAHWLKTWMATRATDAPGSAPGLAAGPVRESVLAAVNRLFTVRFKQRHVLRTARQALAFVARESA